MASFRIHEDQENNISSLPMGKENINVIGIQKRSILGDLNHKNRIQTKNIKHTLQDAPLTKGGNDENLFSRHNITKCSIPAIPVAQFEAFSVYEDQQDVEAVDRIKHESEALAKEKEVNISDEILAVHRPPLQDVKTIIVESPMNTTELGDKSMSIDGSITKAPVRIERDVRELFFEIPEYQEDIYTYLRSSEIRHRPKPGYMRKQPDITHSMRTILVDWLVEVCEEYRLNTETLTLAVSYIDRFLSYMSVVRAKLQLVGTAAMFIASKYEEIYPPDVGEFVYITDDTYTKKQVLRMEHLILKVLAFDLSVPTPPSFISYYCISNNEEEKTRSLAMYFSELSMLEADPYLQYAPSHLAAACLALARYTIEEDAWTSRLEEISGYSMNNLKTCFEHLYKTFEGASTISQQAIQEKYKNSKHHEVALITPRPLENLVVSENVGGEPV